MTRDDIIHMAKKAELHCHMNLTEHSLAIEDLEHFAALVRDDVFNKHTHLWLTRINEAVKAERESCAKLLEGGSFYMANLQQNCWQTKRQKQSEQGVTHE